MTSQEPFTPGCSFQGGWQIPSALFLLALVAALVQGSSSHVLPEHLPDLCIGASTDQEENWGAKSVQAPG